MRVFKRSLVDYYGLGSQHRHPLRFTISDRECVYFDDESLGVDYALFPLNTLEMEGLKRNRIDPFTLCPASFPSDESFHHFYILGFPEERVLLAPTSTSAQSLLAVQPYCIPVERLTDDESKRYRRFAGKIVDKGDLGSIKGLSGGPLFGFVDAGAQSQYTLNGIQSRWDSGKRNVFCCPIASICQHLQDLRRNEPATDA